MDFHRARCICPPGLQGDPFVRCVAVGCQQDEDCQSDERCHYSSQRCVPLCVDSPCAPGATCSARNHKEYCDCLPPKEGDGYVYCELRKCFFISRCLSIQVYF